MKTPIDPRGAATFFAAITAAAAAALAPPDAKAAPTDLLPIQEGYTVVTCFSGSYASWGTPDPGGFVLGIMNTSAPEQALAGVGLPSGAYPWQNFHNETSVQNPNPPDANEEWRNGNLGEVFGITLDQDASPSIYTASTTCYGSFGAGTWPAGEGPGSVYRLDGTTGEVTTFCQLPNNTAKEPSLGQICHHRDGAGNDWIFISNFEDGLIYRRDASGAAAGTFDHGVDGRPQESLAPIADDGSTDATRVGRRVWGIEDYQGRLYYGVWNAPGTPHEIWSVALDAGGNFVPNSAIREIIVPLLSPGGTSPVSDITFSEGGSMFFCERYHRNYAAGLQIGSPHACRVFEYTGGSGSWTPHPTNVYKPGWLNHVPAPNNKNYDSSAGGVAVECEGYLWASCDAGHYPSPYIYGAQRFPLGGNTAEYTSYCDADPGNDIPFYTNSVLIDFDGDISGGDKTKIGDIEILSTECDCLEIEVGEIECPPQPGAPFDFTLTLTNQSGKDAAFLWLAPCPAAELPAGAVTLQPDPSGIQAIPGGLADGATGTFNVQLPASHAGETVCFIVTILDRTLAECCSDKVCVDLPNCDCYQLLDYTIEKSHGSDGTLKWIFTGTILNQSGWTVHYVSFTDPRFDPNPIVLGTPIPPGGTGTFTVCILGAVPAEVIDFYLGIHPENIEECCSQKVTIKLPDCIDQQKDECFLLPRKATCCPDAAGGPAAATFILRICNNSAAPRTYGWNLAALAPSAACPGFIPASNYSPNSGSVTVPANSCVDIPITAICEGEIQPGSCAGYEICIRQTDDPDNFFCCDGQIYAPTQDEVLLKDDPAGGGNNNPAVVQNGVGQMRFIAVNDTDQEVRGTLVISDSGGISLIRLPGGEESTTVSQQVSIPPRGSVDVFFDIILRIDGYEDGRPHTVNVYIFDEATGQPRLQAGPIYVLSPPDKAAVRIVGFANNGDEVAIQFESKDGKKYKVQQCAELGANGGWEDHACALDEGGDPVVEIMDGNGGVIECFLPVEPEIDRMFFRVVEFDEP